MTSSVAGKTCPYCQTRLTGSEEVVICPRCRLPHHAECWRDNGGCTTYGCTGAVAESDPEVTMHPATGEPSLSAVPAAAALPASPAIACLYNLLFAGAGYFYLRQFGKGFIMLAITLTLTWLTQFWGYPVMLLITMLDCYETARARRQSTPRP